MQLTLGLLGSGAEDDQAPVPVPVSASSWTPEYLSDFTTWMADEPGRNYPHVRAMGTDVPKRLVERGHVLPVLDGLDELPNAARAKVIETIDTVLGTQLGLILTCRTDEFEQTIRHRSGVLSTAAVVEPEPLTPAAAAAHLRRHLGTNLSPAWEELLTGLEAPGPHTGPIGVIAAAVATPLDLGLLRTTYALSHTSPEELLIPGRFTTPAALRGHLLDRLIPVLLERNPPSRDNPSELRPRRHYDPDKVRRWLDVLACLLARMPTLQRRGTLPVGWSRPIGRGSRDLRWWTLAAMDLPPRVLPWIQTLTFVTVGASIGAVAGAVSPAEGMPDTATGALRMGILAGVLGLISSPTANSALDHEPRYVHDHNPTVPRPSVWWRVGSRPTVYGTALVGFLIGALTSAAIAWLWKTIAGGAPGSNSAAGIVLYGLVGLTATVTVLSLYRRTEIAWAESHAVTPVGSLRSDRAFGLSRLAVITAFAAVMIGLSLREWNKGYETIVSGLTYGSIALTVALFSGRRAWLAYTAVVAYEACRRNVPFRLMPFLDDAHRLGLLRTVGPVYQFRHAEFQDHLAAQARQRQGSGRRSRSRWSHGCRAWTRRTGWTRRCTRSPNSPSRRPWLSGWSVAFTTVDFAEPAGNHHMMVEPGVNPDARSR